MGRSTRNSLATAPVRARGTRHGLGLLGPLALVVAVTVATAAAARAQGLREDALRLVEAVTAGEGDACGQLESVDALLTSVAEADAEAFMPDEVATLRGARPELVTRCEAQRAAEARDADHLESLLAHCVGLAQARAFCRVVAECAEVSRATARMADFWNAAVAACPR